MGSPTGSGRRMRAVQCDRIIERYCGKTKAKLVVLIDLACQAAELLTNAAWWTSDTTRPDGSDAAAKLSSHAIAAGDEQAIDFPPGTVLAQSASGNAARKCVGSNRPLS